LNETKAHGAAAKNDGRVVYKEGSDEKEESVVEVVPGDHFRGEDAE